MKKLLFALCAVALLGLMTGCVDPVNNQIPSPNYDPIKDKVTTQFYLNIAPASDDTRTKQLDTAVQVTHNFRGLGNATLFTITAPDGDGKKVKRVYKGGNNPQPGDTLFATSYISLSDALKPGSIGPDVSTNSRRVIEISIPRETNTLLFYGEAITGESDDELNAFGGLEYTMDGKNLMSIGCNARRRLHPDSIAATDFSKMETIILDVINHLFMVGINNKTTPNGWENLTGTHDENVGTYVLAGKELHWYDFAECYHSTDISPLPALLKGIQGSTQVVSPMEQALGLVYHAFTTLNEINTGELDEHDQPKTIKELRAGSGMSLVRQIRDIHDVIIAALDSDPMSDEEEIAEILLREIDAYIHLFFEVNSDQVVTGWKNLYTVTTTSGSTNGVIDILKLKHIDDNAPTPSNTVYTLNAFPFHFNLPHGSVTIVKDGSALNKTFKYQVNNISLEDMGGGTMSVYDYTYPPSLVYFGNSPIRVSNSSEIDRAKFPNGVVSWETDASWKAWDTGTDSLWRYPWHVEANTRAVAMMYNVHYGSALLASSVKFSDSVATFKILRDNNFKVNGDPDKNIRIGETLDDGSKSTITLTGILIGGQPNHVGWNYLPADPIDNATDLAFNRMIYDKRLNGGTEEQDGDTGVYLYPVDIPTDGTATATNYTNVFDNYDPNNENQSNVYVALEFVNNLGQDFWGNANMVRSGGTFYVMGMLKLDAAKKAEFNSKWANISPIMPPYYETDEGEHHAGDTKKIVRVFMQNFITTANFTMGPDVLKYAYVTVPDLRSATLSFGLSVDLNWKEGLSFDVPIGVNE